MSETLDSITFRVDKNLKKKFVQRVDDLDRDQSQVLRDFMRSFIREPAKTATAYDEWFRASVAEALNDQRKPISSETVERRFAARRAAARGVQSRGKRAARAR
jgi:hypothetical protein